MTGHEANFEDQPEGQDRQKDQEQQLAETLLSRQDQVDAILQEQPAQISALHLKQLQDRKRANKLLKDLTEQQSEVAAQKMQIEEQQDELLDQAEQIKKQRLQIEQMTQQRYMSHL